MDHGSVLHHTEWERDALTSPSLMDMEQEDSHVERLQTVMIIAMIRMDFNTRDPVVLVITPNVIVKYYLFGVKLMANGVDLVIDER